ncbi:hypothetical protein [Pontibacter rugosus]|uniref:hypothetical protein n=1 Tax=Pontibacter rugosus TaxID=1745966 RepID=UPI00366D4F27
MAKAKIKHGSVLIGGNLQAAYYATSNSLDKPLAPQEGSSLIGNLNFKGAYFVMNDFGVGVDLGFAHESLKVTVDDEQQKYKRTYLLGGPLVRYYLDNGVFGELTLKTGLLNLSAGSDIDLFDGAFGIGYAWFVNEKVSIEPILSFRYYREWSGDNANTTLGPVLGFGVQAYLLRRTSQTIKEGL